MSDYTSATATRYGLTRGLLGLKYDQINDSDSDSGRLCSLFCTGERSFSKLRRIKNAQRTTIGQGRQNMLTLMSIESELLRTIDVNSIIDDFACVKARKHNM